MWGGPAQQDTWDMKPDAPAEYRGEFKPIPTTVPGLQICEHLPRLAKRADKLCLIRSMTHADVNHTTATHYLLTGRPAPPGPLADDWPNYGAVLAKLGRGTGPLPPFVSMMPVVPGRRAAVRRAEPRPGGGLLGPVYDPMRIDADGSKPDYRVGELRPVGRRRRRPRPTAGRGCCGRSTARCAAMERSRTRGDGGALPAGVLDLLAAPAGDAGVRPVAGAAGASASATA